MLLGYRSLSRRHCQCRKRYYTVHFLVFVDMYSILEGVCMLETRIYIFTMGGREPRASKLCMVEVIIYKCMYVTAPYIDTRHAAKSSVLLRFQLERT